MRLPVYESYQQPDDDWLGEIPEHWNVRRTKAMFTLQKSKVGKAAADYTLLSLTLGGVIVRNMDEGGKFPAEFDAYQIVERGDLVFCLFDIDETPRTIGIAHNDGMITGAYSVYRALPSCVPEYACYYFLHLDSFKGLRPFYTGLRKVVRADTFSKVEMPAPPIDEQKQIASFLDYETGKIDALIAMQQQLIALLGEKRQAVISHAVTKGLNPDAPLIKSGIRWAPDVPAHWSLVPNRSLFRIRRVLVGQRHSEYQLLSLTKRGVIVRDPSTGDGKHSDYMERCQEVRPGDLVFCLFDVEETPRTIGLSNHLGMTSGDYTIMECADGLAARFVEYFYIAMDDRKLLRPLYRGLRKRIPKPGFLAARIPLPPPKEQELIVQHLDDMQVKLKRLVEAAHDQVELLQERRTALISAAVTGKIDVRGWKPPSSGAKQETEMEVA